MSYDLATDPETPGPSDPVESALHSWAADQGGRITAIEQRAGDDGASGARLLDVVVRLPGASPVKVIVKACPPGQRHPESARHNRARAHAPEFAQRHLVEQPWPPVRLPDGGYLMFQRPAAGNRVTCRPDQLPAAVQPSAYEQIVRGLLHEWNAGRWHDVETTVGAYLRAEIEASEALD
jgi:hypothetical protein